MSDQQQAAWPALPLDGWRDTSETFHLWTQIIGKVRVAQTPWINHTWNSTLYVTSRGLTTSPIPHGTRTFEIEFDLIAHELVVRTTDGGLFNMPLEPQPVADFYEQLLDALARLHVPVKIHGRPNELENPIPFKSDRTHKSYDKEAVHRFWRALVQADRVFKIFRGRFIGKCSPVHFFWGAADLAVTRFSGRAAPPHPGGIPNLPDRITRDAYSHEVSSCGFWAGGGPIPYPAFYAYAYPEPAGFAEAPVRPANAFYSLDLLEFILPYDAVRIASDPDAVLLEFLQSTYEAAADRAQWNRAALEAAAPGAV
jgi:hypothetical protein